MDRLERRTDQRTFVLLALPAWLILGAFLLVPLLGMLLISFSRRGVYGGLEPLSETWRHLRAGEAFHNYTRSFAWIYLRIFWRSLWIAAVTTGVTLVVSYPVAYYMARIKSARWKSVLVVLVVIPFWTSFLIRTYAWMLILRSEGLVNSFLVHAGLIRAPLPLLYNDFAVLLGLVYGELPFMILPLFASLEKQDRTLVEAAADLGAGRWATFWRITVPLSLPGVAAGAALVFIPSLGQFIVPDLLGGAKSVFVGNIINNQFLSHGRDVPFGSALAFELCALVLAMLLLYALYSRRSAARSSTGVADVH